MHFNRQMQRCSCLRGEARKKRPSRKIEHGESFHSTANERNGELLLFSIIHMKLSVQRKSIGVAFISSHLWKSFWRKLTAQRHLRAASRTRELNNSQCENTENYVRVRGGKELRNGISAIKRRRAEWLERFSEHQLWTLVDAPILDRGMSTQCVLEFRGREVLKNLEWIWLLRFNSNHVQFNAESTKIYDSKGTSASSQHTAEHFH